MTTVLAWRRIKPHINLNPTKATWLEIAVIVIAVLSMYYYASLFRYLYQDINIQKNFAGHGFLIWLAHSGSAPVFSLLILVLALEKGYISRFLSLPFLVLLGEISFSIYLSHYVLLKYYLVLQQHIFAHVPLGIAYIGYWIVLLVSSWAIWQFFELPCRKFFIGLWPKQYYTKSRTVDAPIAS